MTRIVHVLTAPAMGGYYCEDLAALQADPIPPAERYIAAPVTPGFDRVRQVAEAVSVGLVLDTGQVAWGDCVGVAYAGQAGRAPVFYAEEGGATIERVVAPALQGRELNDFRRLAAELDGLTESVQVTRPTPPSEPEVPDPSRRQLLSRAARALVPPSEPESPTERVTQERRLPTAVRYGVSQALLQGVALARGCTMAQVIAQEWDLSLPPKPVPIHAQSGGERYRNADKMIVRRLASLPHALVDNVPQQVGGEAEHLTRYARWLKDRIQELGGPDYTPTLHLDVHGALGQICGNNLGQVLGHLYALELAVQPLALRVESPLILDSRTAQIEAFKKLRDYVRFRDMRVQLVADEWANSLADIQAFVDAGAADLIQIRMPDLGGVQDSVEAVLACRAGGVGAFLGGSCAETDLSARVTVHVALATQPDMLMAKPGMGVDEGVMIVQNEMARALIQIRGNCSGKNK